MKILLSFYPDFKINQLSENTATYFLSNDYDLFIDVNGNPGSWTAQRKRGTLRTDLMLRGGRAPADDVDKADELIKKYQAALVDWITEVENREQEGIKKDIEVLKWHKKHRAPPQVPADQEESQAPGDPEEQEENQIQEEKKEEAKLQPGEDYDTKIEAKYKEIFEALNREISFAQEPECYDQFLKNRLSKIYENLEVLQLLQEVRQRQNLKTFQLQRGEPEIQARDTSISDVIYLNKNSKGYSWRILSKAATLGEALENALAAEKELNKELRLIQP